LRAKGINKGNQGGIKLKGRGTQELWRKRQPLGRRKGKGPKRCSGFERERELRGLNPK